MQQLLIAHLLHLFAVITGIQHHVLHFSGRNIAANNPQYIIAVVKSIPFINAGVYV